MRSTLPWLVLFSFSLLACDSDVFERACTEIGCVDQLSFEIRGSRSAFGDGEITLDATFDEETSKCSFAAPNDLPSQGQAKQLSCSGQLQGSLVQRVMCSEQRNGSSVSQSCQPIDNEFRLDLSISKTPKHVALHLRRGETSLFEREWNPAYERSRPNGPGCDPECTQARELIELP